MHSGTGVGVGYNVQIAVDTKHKLIAEQQVHGQVSDLGLLAETGRAARTSLGVERIDAVADKGYFKVEEHRRVRGGVDHAVCAEATAQPGPSQESLSERAVPLRRGNRHLRLSERAATEAPVHQQGAQLRWYPPHRGACRGCALKVQCTSNSYRRIGRYADEAVLDRMAERLADRLGVLHRRRAPLRLDQALDGPRRVSDAQARERSG